MDKRKLNGHKSTVIWLTGLPAAGKSTIANALGKELMQSGIYSIILDGDQLRKGLNRDLGFSPADRAENVRRVGEVARFLIHNGIMVIVAVVSPSEVERQKARYFFEKDRFIEVFVDCPVDVCEKRDYKGLYAKAHRGDIVDFTGVTALYEKPRNPEIHLRTDSLDTSQCISMIYDYLVSREIINLCNK